MLPDHPDFAAMKDQTAARVLVTPDGNTWPYSEEDAPMAHADHASMGGRLYARVQGGGAGPGTLPYVRVYTQGL